MLHEKYPPTPPHSPHVQVHVVGQGAAAHEESARDISTGDSFVHLPADATSKEYLSPGIADEGYHCTARATARNTRSYLDATLRRQGGTLRALRRQSIYNRRSMRGIVAFTIILCAFFVATALAAPYEDDTKYAVDKELARELANLIYQSSRREPMMFASKRNSELVNTLLGLPKVLNDAGRRK